MTNATAQRLSEEPDEPPGTTVSPTPPTGPATWGAVPPPAPGGWRGRVSGGAGKGARHTHGNAAFAEANKKAAAARRDYAKWRTTERLPKATADFALGADKFQRILAGTELVDLPPTKILALGLLRLKEGQEALEAAAKTINPKMSLI